MKKIVLGIISVYIVFSSSFLTNANEGQIEKILNLNFAVEQIEYKLSVLPNKKFKNAKVQAKYNQIKKINKILVDEFYQKYKSGDIDYYTTKGIISNHKLFIYNTEQLFKYIEKKLHRPSYISVNDDIINSYSNMRMTFNRIKFLYSRSQNNIKKTKQINDSEYEVEYKIEYRNHHHNSNHNHNHNHNNSYNNGGA